MCVCVVLLDFNTPLPCFKIYSMVIVGDFMANWKWWRKQQENYVEKFRQLFFWTIESIDPKISNKPHCNLVVKSFRNNLLGGTTNMPSLSICFLFHTFHDSLYSVIILLSVHFSRQNDALGFQNEKWKSISKFAKKISLSTNMSWCASDLCRLTNKSPYFGV